MDFSKHLFRSHACGHLMTEPKGKSNKEKYNDSCADLAKTQADYDKMIKKDGAGGTKKLQRIANLQMECARLEPIQDRKELSDTTKKHLVHIYGFARYGRKPNNTNKFIEKGLTVEEDSMTLYCRLKKELYFKNEENFRNEFIQGTPDIKHTEIVDLKSSWDLGTFLPKAIEEVDPMYYWQGQAYMALTGTKVFRLAYCLVDTPEVLIEQAKRRLAYEMGSGGFDDLYMEACKVLEHNMIFSDIPKEERLIEIVIERKDEDIQRLYDRVIQCRLWLNEFAGTQERRFVNNTLIDRPTV